MQKSDPNLDAELIRRYCINKDSAAFELLLDRYISKTRMIVRKHCENRADVDDLVQQIWVKIIKSLHHYQDQQKFGAFHNAITKNTLRDYWRFKNVRANTINSEDIDIDLVNSAHNKRHTDTIVETAYDNQQMLQCLMTKLIPALPCDLRTVFILKHESEYWQGKQRLSWQDLGVLTGLTQELAYQSFSLARDGLIEKYHANAPTTSVSELALSIFIIWTQSQRLSKHAPISETQLAALMGIPVNTFKTKYRRAKQQLKQGLEAIA